MRFRVLGSGSSGNTTLVQCGGTAVLIDAGLGARETAERLQSHGVDPASLAAIVISHEHGDHCRGAAALSKKWGVRLMGTRGTYAAGGFGAEDIAGWDCLEPGRPRACGDLTVTGVSVPHDAAGPLAFVLAGDGASLGHATDFGHVNRALVDAFRGCDTVVIESNYEPVLLHDGDYPWSVKERILGRYGHLSNDDVAQYIKRGLGEACRTLVLAHLSRQNNNPDLARMNALSALRSRGRTEVRLEIAEPDGMDWIDVTPAPRASRGPEQLRLF